MRKFENWLEETLDNLYVKTLFVDLANIMKIDSLRNINLGVKTIDSNNIAKWNAVILNVELDFTKEEFIETCAKYGMKYSVFIGE